MTFTIKSASRHHLTSSLTTAHQIQSDESSFNLIKPPNLVIKTQSHYSLQDLPLEILYEILNHLLLPDLMETNSIKSYHHPSQLHPFKNLRLINKTFSQLLVYPLFRSIKIEHQSQASDCLNWYQAYESHQRPSVFRLSISKVKTFKEDEDEDGIRFKTFEDLIDLLAPNLIQLQVIFKSNLESSQAILKSYKRCRQLSTLHLNIHSPSPLHLSTSSLTSQPTNVGGMITGSGHQQQTYSPHILLDLLNALPCLNTLDLHQSLYPCSAPSSFKSHDHQWLGKIVNLSFDLQSHRAGDLDHQMYILSKLTHSFSSSLKTLEIRGSRYDSIQLLPILTSISSHLELLHLSEISILEHCSHLQFPKLQTLWFDDVRFPNLIELGSSIFESVSTLILRTWNAGLDLNESPPLVPIHQLSQLKRIILTHVSRPTKATVPLYMSCARAGVELYLIRHQINLGDLNLTPPSL